MVLTEEERKEKKRVGRRKYYQKNKDKEKANNKKYYRSAKGQAKIKENNERDEVKKRKQEWHARPEQKKKRRAYQL